MDDVRQGCERCAGRVSRGQRALQTQLKRAAATLTVVLHLFQFTVYADCSHTCTCLQLPFLPCSTCLLLFLLCFILLFAVTILLSFNCLLGAVARFSFALLLLLLATRICLPHGKLALFAHSVRGMGGIRASGSGLQGRASCIRGCYMQLTLRRCSVYGLGRPINRLIKTCLR